MRIGINLSIDDLKAPPTPLNGSSSSVISATTTPFSPHNINQNYSSVKNRTQFQSSIFFPENYIVFYGTNLMSTFDEKSLKTVTIKSTTTHKCFTSKTFKSNRYLTSPSIHDDTTSDSFRNTTY